jgi:hypothetical protein
MRLASRRPRQGPAGLLILIDRAKATHMFLSSPFLSSLVVSLVIFLALGIGCVVVAVTLAPRGQQ